MRVITPSGPIENLGGYSRVVAFTDAATGEKLVAHMDWPIGSQHLFRLLVASRLYRMAGMKTLALEPAEFDLATQERLRLHLPYVLTSPFVGSYGYLRLDEAKRAFPREMRLLYALDSWMLNVERYHPATQVIAAMNHVGNGGGLTALDASEVFGDSGMQSLYRILGRWDVPLAFAPRKKNIASAWTAPRLGTKEDFAESIGVIESITDDAIIGACHDMPGSWCGYGMYEAERWIPCALLMSRKRRLRRLIDMEFTRA